MAAGVVAEDLVKAGTQKGCDNPTALWPSTSFLNLVQSGKRSGKRRERDSLDLFAVKASMLPDADAYAAAERLDQRYAYRFFKRLFDITFSALVLALLSGPMLLVALAIKLDSPGPALFRQKRFAPCTKMRRRDSRSSGSSTKGMAPYSRLRMIHV